MNQKQVIAERLAAILPSLEVEAIYNLLEKPKSSEMGDIAFPAFSLAKVERKAPQAIAADIVENLIQLALRTLLQLVLMSTSSWTRLLSPTKS